MKIFLTLIIFLASYPSVFSQLPSDVIRQQEQSQRQRNEDDRRIQQEEFRINRQANESFRRTSAPIEINPITRKKLDEASITEAEYLELIKPNEEDLLTYQDLLRSRKTGIVKLFPYVRCGEGKYVVKIDELCDYVPLGLSRYSFFYEYYYPTVLSDIRIEEKRIFADGFFTQNLLASLGDIPLESINLSNEKLEFLVNFKAPLIPKEADSKYAEISKGILVDGVYHAKDIEITLNTSYVLRLISYRIKEIKEVKRKKEDQRLSKISDREFALRFIRDREETRRDKIIAFRVIRIDYNKGVSILWKELSDKKAPVLNMKTEIYR